MRVGSTHAYQEHGLRLFAVVNLEPKPLNPRCLQADLLWGSLTGREHLLFYGRLHNFKVRIRTHMFLLPILFQPICRAHTSVMQGCQGCTLDWRLAIYCRPCQISCNGW